MINSFMLKNFSIGLLNDEGKEQKFRFSLYLCANDSYAAGRLDNRRCEHRRNVPVPLAG